MEKAKLRTTELAMFEEEVCTKCLNDDGIEKLCPILSILAANGESDLVYERDQIDKETLSFHVCLMRRTEEEISVSSVLGWIGQSSTEEVGEVLREIEDSYHFDVISATRKKTDK